MLSLLELSNSLNRDKAVSIIYSDCRQMNTIKPQNPDPPGAAPAEPSIITYLRCGEEVEATDASVDSVGKA